MQIPNSSVSKLFVEEVMSYALVALVAQCPIIQYIDSASAISFFHHLYLHLHLRMSVTGCNSCFLGCGFDTISQAVAAAVVKPKAAAAVVATAVS